MPPLSLLTVIVVCFSFSLHLSISSLSCIHFDSSRFPYFEWVFVQCTHARFFLYEITQLPYNFVNNDMRPAHFWISSRECCNNWCYICASFANHTRVHIFENSMQVNIPKWLKLFLEFSYYRSRVWIPDHPELNHKRGEKIIENWIKKI